MDEENDTIVLPRINSKIEPECETTGKSVEDDDQDSDTHPVFMFYQESMSSVKVIEIDCLLCGHLKICSQVGRSVSAAKLIPMTEEAGIVACHDTWPMLFCDLLDLDSHANEVEEIIQSAFYCKECEGGLQTIYKMYVQIRTLQAKLRTMKTLYKEKLQNAAASCNSFDQRKMKLDCGSDAAKLKLESQQEKREQLLRRLDRRRCSLSSASSLNVKSAGPLNPENEFEFRSTSFDELANERNSHSDPPHDDFENDSSTVSHVPIFADQTLYPRIQWMNEVTNHKNRESSLPATPMQAYNELYQDQHQITMHPGNKCGNPVSRKTTRANAKIVEIFKPKIKRPSGSTRQVSYSFTKQIHKKYQTTPLRKRKQVVVPTSADRSSSNLSVTELESNDFSCDKGSEQDDSMREGIRSNESLCVDKSIGGRRGAFSNAEQSINTSNKLDQNKMDQNQKELRVKYGGLIKKYDVKEVVVSVDKLPDADFDAAAVGGEDGEGRGKKRCPILGCEMIFLKKYRLADHLKTVHRGIKYPYECSTCLKKFAQRRQFTDHENIHTKLTPHVCSFPDCGKKFSTLGRLFGHKGSHHKQPRYQCKQCGKCFIIKSSYDYHIRSHLGERPFICEICGKTFIKEFDLKNHQRFHPELNLEQLRCKFCGKIFTSPNSLKVHEKFHSGDLPFCCDLCEYRAPTNYVLNKHKLVHKVGQEYECDICHGKFKHGNSLAKHKKYVCGISKDCKDFLCKFCGKGYKSKIHVAKHELLHTDTTKPFLCSMCGKDFRFRDKLERHISQVHTEKNEKLKSNRSEAASSKSKSRVTVSKKRTKVVISRTTTATAESFENADVGVGMVFQSPSMTQNDEGQQQDAGLKQNLNRADPQKSLMSFFSPMN